MTDYKYLVLTDLDGTLLNGEGHVSRETVDFVRKLNERDDILFSFSTGRSWEDAKYIYELLQLKGFVSCCNGSFIHNPQLSVSHYVFISEKFWIFLLNSAEFFDGLKRGTVLSDKISLALTTTNLGDVIRNLRDRQANVFSLKIHFNKPPEGEVSKFIREKIFLIKQAGLDLNVSVFTFEGSINFEIQASYVNKETAVKFLGNYYGVRSENIFTFGDENNDLSVAWGSSNFCAVNNAIDLVLLKARRISKYTNDQDAVIREIGEILKNV